MGDNCLNPINYSWKELEWRNIQIQSEIPPDARIHARNTVAKTLTSDNSENCARLMGIVRSVRLSAGCQLTRSCVVIAITGQIQNDLDSR